MKQQIKELNYQEKYRDNLLVVENWDISEKQKHEVQCERVKVDGVIEEMRDKVMHNLDLY